MRLMSTTNSRPVPATTRNLRYVVMVLPFIVALTSVTRASATSSRVTVAVDVKRFSYSSIRLSFRMEFFPGHSNLTFAFIQPDISTGNISFPKRYVFRPGEMTNANTTVYFVESDFDLNWNQQPFPQDEFNATYYVALSKLLTMQDSHQSTMTIGSPNFDAYWKLDQITDQLQNIKFQPVRDDLRDMKAWFRLQIRIWHHDDFRAYATIFTEAVPCFFKFVLLLLCSVFLSIFMEAYRNRGFSRPLESVKHIERVLIPICAAFVVFFPLYAFAVHSLAAPLPYIHADFTITNLLVWYLVILSVGIVVRVFVSLMVKPHDR